MMVTANKIAELFGKVLGSSINKIHPAQLEALIQVQREFEQLVEIRDQLLHAHPCTAPSGAQQLFYSGGRHEMLHEVNRRDAITNLLVWLSGILERSS